jgi:hypothetical protein
MRRNVNILTAALLVLAATFQANAYFSQGDAGQEVFSFMSTFDSPRNAALEKSAAAQPSTDPSVAQLNPASLRMPEGKQRMVGMHWQTGEFAENQGTIHYTTRFRDLLYQVSYNWLDYGSIDGYDEYGNETGKTYEPLSQLITATFAFPLKHFQFGTTLKFASDRLAEEEGDRTAWGAAFDWGLSWQAANKLWGFAIVARDFGCLLRDYVDDGDDEYYPMGQVFALSGFKRFKTLPRFTLFGETNFPRYAEARLNLGAEYLLGKSFAIRAGFTRTWLDLKRDALELIQSRDRPDESNEARLLSVGLGYSADLFALDYGFSYLAQGMGMEHRMGLRINF